MAASCEGEGGVQFPPSCRLENRRRKKGGRGNGSKGVKGE